MDASPSDPELKGLDLVGFRYVSSSSYKSSAHIGANEPQNIISLVFFPTYIIFQIPSTVIVRVLGPRVHLGTITLLWGSIMVAMAFIKDWETMAGMRVLLGILEVCQNPLGSNPLVPLTDKIRLAFFHRVCICYQLGIQDVSTTI
jgi:hypothetical protein